MDVRKEKKRKENKMNSLFNHSEFFDKFVTRGSPNEKKKKKDEWFIQSLGVFR